MGDLYKILDGKYTKAKKEKKVIDVSEITDDGRGIRIVKKPGVKSTKKYVEGVPVVSDNYNNYAFALEVLGRDFLPYANEFYRLYGEGRIEKAPKSGSVYQAYAEERGFAQPRSPRSLSPERNASLYDILAGKYRKAEDERKVVDVSDMTADGRGIHIIKAPKGGSSRSSKKQVEGVVVVSDNYNNYAAAMDILGADFVPYAAEYRRMYGMAKNPSPGIPVRQESPKVPLGSVQPFRRKSVGRVPIEPLSSIPPFRRKTPPTLPLSSAGRISPRAVSATKVVTPVGSATRVITPVGSAARVIAPVGTASRVITPVGSASRISPLSSATRISPRVSSGRTLPKVASERISPLNSGERISAKRVIPRDSSEVNMLTADQIQTKLYEAYDAANSTGSVVDVSDILALISEGNFDIVYLISNEEAADQGKVGLEGVPIVSNNYDAYAYAMDFLGNDFAAYKQYYADYYSM